MTSKQTPDRAAFNEMMLKLLGPNDPEPTEAERLAHRQDMEDLRQARAAAYRTHQRAEVRRLQVDLAKRKATRDAGEPYVEDGEPI